MFLALIRLCENSETSSGLTPAQLKSYLSSYTFVKRYNQIHVYLPIGKKIAVHVHRTCTASFKVFASILIVPSQYQCPLVKRIYRDAPFVAMIVILCPACVNKLLHPYLLFFGQIKLSDQSFTLLNIVTRIYKNKHLLLY